MALTCYEGGGSFRTAGAIIDELRTFVPLTLVVFSTASLQSDSRPSRPRNPTTLHSVPPRRVYSNMFRSFRDRRQRGPNAPTSETTPKGRRGSPSKSNSPPSSRRFETPKGTLTSQRTSLTTRIESFFTTPHRQEHDIESVVLKIEWARRHHKTKIFERQAPCVLSYADTMKYEKLCGTLLEYLEVCIIRFTHRFCSLNLKLEAILISPQLQDYASSEVIRIVIAAPVIRRTMNICHNLR